MKKLKLVTFFQSDWPDWEMQKNPTEKSEKALLGGAKKTIMATINIAIGCVLRRCDKDYF